MDLNYGGRDENRYEPGVAHETKTRGSKMDAGHILVGVLTSAAVGWLVWAELNSRRNSSRADARKVDEAEAGREKQ